MTEVAAARPRHDLAKWALFAALGVLVALSAWIDDRFIFNRADPEWRKFATWWPLIPHVFGGLATLLIGPLQFSDTLRAAQPAVHRWLGRTYIIACLIAAPLGGLVAWQHHEWPSRIPFIVLAGGWTLTTVMAWLNIRRRNIPAHKLWMMRSYGFCMVFIFGRLPDAIPNFPWDGVPGVTVLWSAVAIALVLPDLMLNTRELLRRRG
jgi:uncharacterized membrane protein